MANEDSRTRYLRLGPRAVAAIDGIEVEVASIRRTSVELVVRAPRDIAIEVRRAGDGRNQDPASRG